MVSILITTFLEIRPKIKKTSQFYPAIPSVRDYLAAALQMLWRQVHFSQTGWVVTLHACSDMRPPTKQTTVSLRWKSVLFWVSLTICTSSSRSRYALQMKCHFIIIIVIINF